MSKVPWNTGIDVNTMTESYHAYIYLVSWHSDGGDATRYEFGVIRLGYDGNHATKYKVSAYPSDAEGIDVSVSDSRLIITPRSTTRTFITLIH